mgnify:CR=1 FL=1
MHLPDCDRFPVLVWLHEGGLINGDKKIKMLDSFVEKGIAVVPFMQKCMDQAFG